MSEHGPVTDSAVERGARAAARRLMAAERDRIIEVVVDEVIKNTDHNRVSDS